MFLSISIYMNAIDSLGYMAGNIIYYNFLVNTQDTNIFLSIIAGHCF